MKVFWRNQKVKRIIVPLIGSFFLAVVLLIILFSLQSTIQNSSSGTVVSQKESQLLALPRRGFYNTGSSQGITQYDEQLGNTFTGNFTSLGFSVTAIAQTDTTGIGPGYYLNGLGNTGYWYQVGLAYNWSNVDGTHVSGFQLNYEVYNSLGNSVFPSNGYGGAVQISPVNPGDTVNLGLSFSDGNVIMQGTDQNTGATAQETYSAEGATLFDGNPTSWASSVGFFTGLMTEWYHNSPYYGGEQKVVYGCNGGTISSAWMWIDEFAYSLQTGIGAVVFPTAYTNSPLTFTNNPTQLQTLSSNGATESMDANQFNTGGVTPVNLAFGYSIVGGTGASSAPVLTYISSGIQQTAPLTQANQTFSIDLGTTWSIKNPTSTSTTERWQTLQATTGTATSSQTINLVFYHQYLVTFGFNVIGGGTGYSAPAVTCQQFGSTVTPTMGTQVWADSAQYNIPSSLVGSSSSERWATNSASGTISASGNVSITYYHQFLTTAIYSVIGGGTPNAPTLASTAFGAPLSQALTTQALPIWIDSGASYSLTNPLPGSTTSEQWKSSSTVSGNASSSSTVNVTYYHQYLATISYSISGGGAPGSPTLTSTSFGSPLSQPLTTQAQAIWIDSGASYSLTNPLPGSTTSERWQSNNTVGNVISAAALSIAYYHQYLTTASYSIVGGGTPGSPTLTSTAFGAPLSQALTTQAQAIWIDSGASYSLTNPLPGSTTSERWQSNAAGSGNVSSSSSIIIPYDHQYYITTNQDPATGGSVSVNSGWFDAGTSFQATAPAASGWQFESWNGSGQGSYTGTSVNLTAVVNSQITETATFYPGLTITTPSEVSVSYSYGSAAGYIPAGTPSTIFVPQGTNIQLTAKPKFFIFKFDGWMGLSTSNESAISVVLNSPSSIIAEYSYNYVNIGIVAAVVIAVIVGLVLLLTRRRRIPA